MNKDESESDSDDDTTAKELMVKKLSMSTHSSVEETSKERRKHLRTHAEEAAADESK